jgi:hypothetical protein
LLSQSSIETKFSHCPEVIAAYLEVVNMIWEFQRSQSQPLSKIPVSYDRSSASALLKIQKTVTGIILASEVDKPLAQLKDLLLAPGIGGDTLAAALEALPRVWAASSASDNTLEGLCQLYVDICLVTGFTEAQVVALQNLADILDKLILENKFDLVSPTALTELWTALPLRPMNPALSNAIIRVSGGLLAMLRHRDGVPTEGITAWGLMIADAGLDDKVSVTL